MIDICPHCGFEEAMPNERTWDGDPMRNWCQTCCEAVWKRYVDFMIRVGARPQTPGSRYTGD
jgi:hypothetical protein